MVKPFDTSMKFFAEDHSVDWVEHLGHGKQPTVVIDADLATVVGASDKIILVGRGKNRWLLLIEMLASYKDYIPERTHWHSTLLAHRHSLPVRSVIVLLRPEADGPAMTGSFERGFPGEMPYDIFRYRIVRIWQISVQTLLCGGLGLVPLAAVADVSTDELPAVIREIRRRITREVPEKKSAEMLAATYLLMGLRYDKALIASLKKEVLKMEESITYQEIVGIGEARGEARGRAVEARRMLITIGQSRLGLPTRRVKKALDSILEPERLEALGGRLLDVKTWNELLEKI